MDPNMRIAYYLGRGLAPKPLHLPPALQPIDPRAEFIVQVNEALPIEGTGGFLVGPQPGVAEWERMGIRLRRIADLAAGAMADPPDPFSRVSIALRLWAGCLDGGKTIALETLSGRNTPDRARDCEQLIHPRAADDPLYRAGVEAAPAFKREYQQPYSLAGVPADSPLRRYVNDN
jgi:hypothetical protein